MASALSYVCSNIIPVVFLSCATQSPSGDGLMNGEDGICGVVGACLLHLPDGIIAEIAESHSGCQHQQRYK